MYVFYIYIYVVFVLSFAHFQLFLFFNFAYVNWPAGKEADHEQPCYGFSNPPLPPISSDNEGFTVY